MKNEKKVCIPKKMLVLLVVITFGCILLFISSYFTRQKKTTSTRASEKKLPNYCASDKRLCTTLKCEDLTAGEYHENKNYWCNANEKCCEKDYILNSSTHQQIQEAKSIVVCSSDSTSESECDYYGGEGIQEAINSVEDNSQTRILVKNGVYKNNKPFVSGDNSKCNYDTKGKSFEIVGQDNVSIEFPDERAFCITGGVVRVTTMHFTNNNGGRMPIGIKVQKDARAVIKSNVFSGFYYAIFITGKSKAQIVSNTIANSTFSGIMISESEVIILSNQIERNNEGIRFQNSKGDEGKVVIALNTIRNNKSGVIILDYNYDVHAIKNNLIYNNQDGGLLFNGKGSITNNTFYANGQYAISIEYVQTDGPTVSNNIIAKTSAKSSTNEIAGILTKGGYFPILLYNNLFWNNVENLASTLKEGVAFADANGDYLVDMKLLISSPRFVDENKNNFHISKESPAKNAGYSKILNDDGSPSDIGAFGGPIGKISGLDEKPSIGGFGGDCAKEAPCQTPFTCLDINGTGTFVSGVCR